MSTTINDPRSKINSDLQQLCFVWGCIQLSGGWSEALDLADLSCRQQACRPTRSDAKQRSRKPCAQAMLPKRDFMFG
jgi:hypothetical protein